MSAADFYLNKGYTQEYRFVSFTAAGTIALWTPRGSARVVITDLSIASNLGGSLSLGWSYASGGKGVFTAIQAGSTTVSPIIGSIEGTGLAETLWANISSGGSTPSYYITATGFEIPWN